MNFAYLLAALADCHEAIEAGGTDRDRAIEELVSLAAEAWDYVADE